MKACPEPVEGAGPEPDEGDFELIEIELTRARAMAARADALFLVYLIEMAMIEARAKAYKNSLETLNIGEM